MRPAVLLLAAFLAAPLPCSAWQDGFFQTRSATPPEAPVDLSAALDAPRAATEAPGPDLRPLRDASAAAALPGGLLLSAAAGWQEDRERYETHFSVLQAALSLGLGGGTVPGRPARRVRGARPGARVRGGRRRLGPRL